MSDSKTMMLAKEFDSSKATFPLWASPKYDGVPVVICFEDGHRATAYTRQGEVVHSINHILKHFQSFYETMQLGSNIRFVGELYRHGRAFKDISGEVRRQDGSRADVALQLFDAFFPDSNMPFDQRILHVLRAEELIGQHDLIRAADFAECACPADLARCTLVHTAEGYEGTMVRTRDHVYAVGKRSWGMMKFKPKPTVDLIVQGFEEAVSKEGEPLGMIGRINCWYKGTVIGVGPGKFTHAERVAIWNKRAGFIGKVLEVQYMKDDTYDALRQPTAQHWRFEKTEASYE